MNRTGSRCDRLLRIRTDEARMSGQRAAGSQPCKPWFAPLHPEVAPRADKSIRVHERHDNRQEPSPPDAFPLVARTSDPRPLGYEPTSRRLQSPPTSQPRRSRLIARPSHRAASHPIAAVAPRFAHKSVHDKTSSKCSRPRRDISSGGAGGLYGGAVPCGPVPRGRRVAGPGKPIRSVRR